MAKRPALTVINGAKGFAPPEDVEELAIAKCAASGITRADAKRLGFTWHHAAEMQAEGFWNLPGLKLPYFKPNGKREPLAASPKAPGFYRVRALRQPDPLPDDFSKYLQPKRSGVCAYFPPTTDWVSVLTDTTQTIIITEGELKAAKASIDGFPAIGLGGVNSYASLSQGVSFLPELEAIDWVQRIVYLIFDSDIQGNSNVAYALNDLAHQLVDRGALCRLLLLPPGENDTKQGLDDYLVARGADVLSEHMRSEFYHLAYADVLWGMNQKYAYVTSMDRVLNVLSGRIMPVLALKNVEKARFVEQKLDDEGNLSYRRTNAAQPWLDWPLRQDVVQLTYDPAQEPLALIPTSGRGEAPDASDFNTWTGWGCEPAEGDASLFLELVDHIFTGAEAEAKEWFLNWCAYPIQFPGTKLFSSVVIHGVEQGTGKSLIGYTLGLVYGRNFTEIKQSDIHSSFNEWAVGRQLIMGDDVTGSDKRADLDMLKKMITQKEIRINEKNVPAYTLPDHINYLWTSNQPNAFFLEDNDRRFFVHKVTVGPREPAFYQRYDQAMKSDEFGRAVHHYLKTRKLGSFNPAAKAYTTVAKSEMTRGARSDLANWVRDVLEHPDDFLRLGDMPLEGDLFTNAQLRAAYCAQAGVNPENVSASRVGNELARAGVNQVCHAQPIRVPGARADRYYAIRNRAKWDIMDNPKEVIRYLEDVRAGVTPVQEGDDKKTRAKKLAARMTSIADRAKKFTTRGRGR